MVNLYSMISDFSSKSFRIGIASNIKDNFKRIILKKYCTSISAINALIFVKYVNKINVYQHLYVPCSRFPIPDSRFPIPDSLYSQLPTRIKGAQNRGSLNLLSPIKSSWAFLTASALVISGCFRYS